jgi:flagellar biosynthesis GTPase FlhF
MDYLQKQLDNVSRQARQHTLDIEQYAKEHVNDAPEDIEKQLNQRLHNFRTDINKQLSAVENSIFQQAPKKNEPNYDTKQAHYRKFLSGASNGLKRMSDMLNNLFTRLKDVFSKILQWIVENLSNIVASIVILFEKVIFPLLKSMKT